MTKYNWCIKYAYELKSDEDVDLRWLQIHFWVWAIHLRFRRYALLSIPLYDMEASLFDTSAFLFHWLAAIDAFIEFRLAATRLYDFAEALLFHWGRRYFFAHSRFDIFIYFTLFDKDCLQVAWWYSRRFLWFRMTFSEKILHSISQIGAHCRWFLFTGISFISLR